MSLFRGPFKRKSTPLTPTAKQRTRTDTKVRSQSLGSLSVNSTSASDLEAVELEDTTVKQSSSKSVLFVDGSTNTYADLNDVTTPSKNCDTNNSNIPSTSSSPVEMGATESPQTQLLTVEINTTGSTKSSIDARLDQIDEINKSLDDKMKKPQPDEGLQCLKINYDAITEVKTEDILINDAQLFQPTQSIPTITIETPEIKSILKDTKEVTQEVSEDPSASFTGVIPKKRSSSFSNRSLNSILLTFKEMSFTRNFSSSKSHLRRKSIDCTISPGSNHQQNSTNTTEGKFLKQSSKRMKHEKKISKSKKSLRSTFRTRLQMFNTSKNKGKCDRCSKRKIHPSKSVADFKKEFHTDEMFENEFCMCTNGTNNASNNHVDQVTAVSPEDANVITIKEHTYSELFGVSTLGIVANCLILIVLAFDCCMQIFIRLLNITTTGEPTAYIVKHVAIMFRGNLGFCVSFPRRIISNIKFNFINYASDCRY